MSPKSDGRRFPLFYGCNTNKTSSNSQPRPSHNNSQHVLAIVLSKNYLNNCGTATTSDDVGTPTEDDSISILKAFSKTSALSCDVWESRKRENGNDNDPCSILLSSNYPNCILESENFCVLSAGFPYHYKDAFAFEACETNDSVANGTESKTETQIKPISTKSFSRTVLDFCEALAGIKNNSDNKNQTTIDTIDISESIGRCLKKVSGHFSLYLVRKSSSRNTLGFWAWNDPFGFMPVYHRHYCRSSRSNNNNNSNTSTTVLSSHWDCMVPTICSPSTPRRSSSLQLDWDIVAEYLTFGTTLGGKRCVNGGGGGFDRTLVKGIENLLPGTYLSFEEPASFATGSATNTNNRKNEKDKSFFPTVIAMKPRSYILCYGACEELLWAKRSGNDVNNTTSTCNSQDIASADNRILTIPLLQKRRCFFNVGSSSCFRTNSATHDIPFIKLDKTKNNNLHYIDRKNLISPLQSSIEERLKTNDTTGAPSPSTLVLGKMFAAFSSCIEEALVQGHVGRAALTGGGDTRLILACLLLKQQQQQLLQLQKQQHPQQQPTCKTNHLNININTVPAIVFQTHSKQKTDWYIARHLALLFGLKHQKINATSTTLEGWNHNNLASLLLFFRNKEDVLLSNLHDQTPLRRKQKKKIDKHKEDTVSYTLHGRFGTEFLGCLCFDKSPLDIRTKQEVLEFRPRATKWFQAIFRPSSAFNATNISNNNDDDNDDDDEPRVQQQQLEATSIRNPIDTLWDRFEELEEDKHALEKTTNVGDQTSRIDVGFDAAYAFQLQLYTRSCLSDIYKGLRGGSWFSIPTAQFSRNAITPFLDNTLLRLLLCCVSTRVKEEPYELYGRLYNNNNVDDFHHLRHHFRHPPHHHYHFPHKHRHYHYHHPHAYPRRQHEHPTAAILDILRRVPSNNKLLCNHTTIPRAIKSREAKSRPYVPKNFADAAASTKQNRSKQNEHQQQQALRSLRDRFHPVFWKGAVAIFEKAPVKMDPESVGNDTREEIRALVELVGSAQDACLLSGRLQSFLLWHDRRFLVHL